MLVVKSISALHIPDRAPETRSNSHSVAREIVVPLPPRTLMILYWKKHLIYIQIVVAWDLRSVTSEKH